MVRSAAASAAAAAAATPCVFSSLRPRWGRQTGVDAAAASATATTTTTTTTCKRARFLLQPQQHPHRPHRQQARRQYCTLWRDRLQLRSSPALKPASAWRPFTAPPRFAAKSRTSQSGCIRTYASEQIHASESLPKPAERPPVAKVPGTGAGKAQVKPLDKEMLYSMLVSQARGGASPFPAPSTSPAPDVGTTPKSSTTPATSEPRPPVVPGRLTVCEHPSNPETYTVTIRLRPRNTFMSLNCPVGKQILSASLGHLGYRHTKKRGYEPSYQLGVHFAQKIESRRLPVRLVEICLLGFGVGRDAAIRGFMSATRRQVIRLTDRSWLNWSNNPRPRCRPRK